MNESRSFDCFESGTGLSLLINRRDPLFSRGLAYFTLSQLLRERLILTRFRSLMYLSEGLKRRSLQTVTARFKLIQVDNLV